MADFFGPVIEQYRLHFLTQLAKDYNLPLDELIAKYQVVPKKPKVPKVLTDPCPIKTSKGEDCKHNCVPGQGACKMHSKPQVEKPPKAPKKIKKVKDIPEHNHKPFEKTEEYCELCESHGDILNPLLSNVEFMNMNLQERLSSIMNQM